MTVSETADSFTLSNSLLCVKIEKRSGTLLSLAYHGLEFIAQTGGGANGGYWSSVGRGRPGSNRAAVIRVDPTTNNGDRAEISCELHNDPKDPSSPVDVDYRYSLGRDEHWLYVSALLEHKPGYPAFGVGEARYCLKLNPVVFDYLSIDANRRRIMPSPYDWDHGAPLNLKEARRMTTGIHKGEAEHKYDYSAVFSDTPAYGWSSTKHNVGFWMINPSLEYLGGGPTKAELTGHLDVNPGGLPTLLNMWVGSHYGGTTVSVATNESWSKFVGPFVLYCNSVPPERLKNRELKTDQTAPERRVPLSSGGEGRGEEALSSDHTGPTAHARQAALWQDSLQFAASENTTWPYSWVRDTNYPSASARATISGQIILRDPYAPDQKLSNLWVGVTAPEYTPPPRSGFGFGRNFFQTNSPGSTNTGLGTNFARRGVGGFRGGFPPQVDWQRDAKFYQFWTRADAAGRFNILNVRPGNYTLHAFADGVIGEFALTNINTALSEMKLLGELLWTPARFGKTVFQIGIPDRTAREFRHGDHYWQWGLYFDYPKEFPNDVNFIVGKSDWGKDWNYVQPPRIESSDVAVVSEDDENPTGPSPSPPLRERVGERRLHSSTWAIVFNLAEAPQGRATLRIPFCGTHLGCNVEVFANDKSVGETGILPSTSAMQRDGISGYWIEKDITFEADRLIQGTNTIKLRSHANSWSQGVMYDCVRLEVDQVADIRVKK